MLQSFKMALKSIWGNKLRSFLTMLGIIIGVASVIILVSIVNGYMSYMVESFSSMGVNQITVQYKAVASRTIDVDEFYEFYEEHSDLYENMSPNVSVSVTVKHDSDTMDSTSVGGYSEDYLAIKDYEIEYGRNLQYSDMEARRKVAVIGAYVAEELYGGSQNAVGETVKLNGDSYTIVGVVERQTESSSEFDDGCMDDFVWIPYSRAVKMARNAVINNHIFTSRDINDTETCTTELKNFLYEKMKSENLYTVTAMSSLLDSLNEQIAMMSMMLGGIAGISLLVAGVGVMNIMLVSVTERTQEIGLKKAIGAKKGHILGQFLTEAAVLTSLGGIIGVVAGIILAEVISKVSEMPIVISVPAAIIAVAFSMGIGIIFGLLPSYKAANLKPIDALRRE